MNPFLGGQFKMVSRGQFEWYLHLKDNTEIYSLKFASEKKIKIKIEVDINPPLGFETEQKLLLQPYFRIVSWLQRIDLSYSRLDSSIFNF